ncbi:hypothetical protein [Streptacidiphilus monticola]|uniref:Uncharacterized protein n=1 Tax=Streptacidiphilus monticola TaxID=2161674 RepID=A0ABW1G9Z8_9ACTN
MPGGEMVSWDDYLAQSGDGEDFAAEVQADIVEQAEEFEAETVAEMQEQVEEFNESIWDSAV